MDIAVEAETDDTDDTILEDDVDDAGAPIVNFARRGVCLNFSTSSGELRRVGADILMSRSAASSVIDIGVRGTKGTYHRQATGRCP